MRRHEYPILAAMFLDLLGFGMLIPDVQIRADKLGAPGVLIGVFLASTFIIQTLLSPIWGRISDERGRKSIILLCTALSALGMLVYGLAGGLMGILASRVIAGLGGANVAVAQAYIADVTDGEERTRAMGRVSAALTTGLIIGPGVGGLLAAKGGHLLVGVSAAIASGLAVVALALFVPSVPPKGKASTRKLMLFDVTLLRDFPLVRPLAIISMIAWFSLAMLEGTFGRLISHNLNMGQREFGWIFSYESLLSIVVQTFLLVWLSKRITDQNLLRGAYVFQGIGLAAFPFAPGLTALFLASTIYALGTAAANPTIFGLCSKLTPEDRQGELFGVLQGARSIGFAVGPVLGGYLFDLNPNIPYLVAGCVCIVAAGIVNIPNERVPVHG